jgi:hypothetical protein
MAADTSGAITAGEAESPANRHFLLEEVKRGLADIVAGRTEDADTAIARLQRARKFTSSISKPTKRRG